jgi:hypothetical protein
MDGTRSMTRGYREMANSINLKVRSSYRWKVYVKMDLRENACVDWNYLAQNSVLCERL